MNRDELYAEAKRLNIPNRSKMNKSELEDAIRQVHGITPVGKLNETVDGRADLDTVEPPTHNEHVAAHYADSYWYQQATNVPPIVMPKVGDTVPGGLVTAVVQDSVVIEPDVFHSMCTIDTGCSCLSERNEIDVPAVEQARDMMDELTEAYPQLLDVSRQAQSRGVSHMPNSERVQKYAVQRVPGRMSYIHARVKNAKLTHRQMRRVRKNANKHGEDFKYLTRNQITGTFTPPGGHSLLARTPDGLGIFYQFSYVNA